MSRTEVRVADETCSRSQCADYGTYEIPWSCFNCGLKFTARFTKTHEARRVTCPRCGVSGGGKRW